MKKIVHTLQSVTGKATRPAGIAAIVLVAALFSSLTIAQEQPWFGVQLPPGLDQASVPAAIGSRGPAPAVVPVGEEGFHDLDGRRLAYDLDLIVEFSRQSQRNRELGGDQLWGRVSGFYSGETTVRWAAERMLDAGIEDVRFQRFDQDPGASLWIPEKWEVRLLGNPVFGTGSKDVVLESSMALAPSVLPGGELTAPIVYVGKASSAELMHIDVTGKIALQHVTPQAHLVFERASAIPSAQALFDRGAVAVITLIDQPGNERVRDFANCGGPCFNLGGQDSWFLQHVMDAAAEAGTFDQLQMRLQLQARQYSGLNANNAIAVIPGRGSDETIVINAHADAWFDGAGDNADGLAVLLALARHFGKPEHQLTRTLALVVSAGHHSSGLNGPRNAVRMNPDVFQNALLIFNIEHVAQRNLVPARFMFADGYRQFTADSGEAPIVAGITNESAYLQDLFTQGVARYGTNFMSSNSTMASGEGGGYRSTNVPIVTTMQSPPLYHTSGEVKQVISTPGLERMARFMTFFIEQIDRAERDLIDPPPL